MLDCGAVLLGPGRDSGREPLSWAASLGLDEAIKQHKNRVLLLVAQREMQHMASVKSSLSKKNTCLYDQHLCLVLITHILSVHVDCRVI